MSRMQHAKIRAKIIARKGPIDYSSPKVLVYERLAEKISATVAKKQGRQAKEANRQVG